MRDAASFGSGEPSLPPSAPCPANAGPAILVVQPHPSRALTLAILSQECVGYWTHFDQRTRPCLGSGAGCIYCARGIGSHWYGYLPCVCVRSLTPVLAQISAGAWRGCSELVQTNGQLRGRVIRLWRGGKTNTGPMGCELQKGPYPCDLPPAFDPGPVLARLWGLAPHGRIIREPIPAPKVGYDDDPETAGIWGGDHV